nr:non-classical arabinogalactan protein 31-like [Salvelinus alpinus]
MPPHQPHPATCLHPHPANMPPTTPPSNMLHPHPAKCLHTAHPANISTTPHPANMPPPQSPNLRTEVGEPASHTQRQYSQPSSRHPSTASRAHNPRSRPTTARPSQPSPTSAGHEPPAYPTQRREPGPSTPRPSMSQTRP